MPWHAKRWVMCAMAMLGLALGCGAGRDDEPQAAQAGEPVATSSASRSVTTTLRHRSSRFSVRAPRGYRLSVSKGVYVLRKGARTMSFSRAVTASTPTQFGTALLEQLGGQVVTRREGARQFVAEVDRGEEREALVVSRSGRALAVTTSTSPRSRPTPLATVRRVGSSARGGFSLEAPAAQPAPELELQPYRAPDGGSTAMVPAQPGWTFDGGGGTVQGTSDRGAFLFGLSFNFLVPERAPAGYEQSRVKVAPYMDAPQALTDALPLMFPDVSDITIRQVLKEGVLPGFSSSGFYLVDYRINGQSWTGASLIATDSPDKYSGFSWNLYYSAIGVPAGSDGSVGAQLLKTWASWNPSGAIAQRTAQAKQLIEETNQVWKDTNEFRSRTAERQSRDVGCLLAGYYDVEDNSRKYDLPPLPCGRQYVPGA